uniref:Uncharacterized protein n=1 Tax=Glossina brevipalpis TaxID=37001 RepID=A0A1A9WWX3_9MUSC
MAKNDAFALPSLVPPLFRLFMSPPPPPPPPPPTPPSPILLSLEANICAELLISITPLSPTMNSCSCTYSMRRRIYTYLGRRATGTGKHTHRKNLINCHMHTTTTTDSSSVDALTTHFFFRSLNTKLIPFLDFKTISAINIKFSRGFANITSNCSIILIVIIFIIINEYLRPIHICGPPEKGI